MSNFRIYNDTLCPDLWDEGGHLDPEIRMNLLQMTNDFYEKTELPALISDIYLMGSAANYNWTPDSDIDVHVIIDYSKLQMPPETAIKTVKTAGAQWNSEHNVLIKGHKVEMNLQNAAEQKPYVMGIYSLTKDQWIRKPFKLPFNLDRQVLKFQYTAMKGYVQNSVGSRDREQMKSTKKYLDAYRQYGLDTYGELSYENIIYKMLRARGIIKQLKDSITQVYDQQMTVKEIGLYENKMPEFTTLTLFNCYIAGHPGRKHFTIYEFGSHDPGKGNAKKALQELKQRYGYIAVTDIGYSDEKSYKFWKHMLSKKVVDEVHDADGKIHKKSSTMNEVGYKDIKQSHPAISKADSSELGNPNIDRSYFDKFNLSKGYSLERLTLDELKALREKTKRFHSLAIAEGDIDLAKISEVDFYLYNSEIKRRIKYINNPVNEGNDPEYNVAYDFAERRDKELYDLATLLKKSKGKGRVPWKTISATLLKKTWLLFGKYNKVNENDIDKIADQILTNIARLRASTEMMGHSQIGKDDIEGELGIEFTDKEWNEWMSNYFTNNEGSWMLSDYGLPQLEKIYGQIFNADTPEEKLYACDKALNVVHQRNDLAAMFVEGGTSTLNAIKNQGGYDAGGKYGDVNKEFRNEVTQKSINSKYPLPTAVHKDYERMEMMTLDNLKSMRDKAARLFKWSTAQEHPEHIRWSQAQYDKYAKEIKRRMAYINNPVNERKLVNEVKNFSIKFNEPDIVKSAGKIFLGNIWFANAVPVAKDWNPKYAGKWFINRHQGAFDLNLPVIEKYFDTPNDMLNFLETWYNTISIKEGYGAGIPEEDRLKIEDTDGSTRRWQIRSKNAPKTPKMMGEEVIAIPKFDKPQEVTENIDPYRVPGAQNVAHTLSAMNQRGPRVNLFPKNDAEEIPLQVRKIISTAERMLDKRSVTRPFFEVEYVEDLVGDITASEFPKLPYGKLSVLIHEVVRWLARDYDIRQNGKRLGE